MEKIIALRGCEHHRNGWELQGKSVRLFVTEDGGQTAPVQFFAENRKHLEPYFISPWQDEPVDLADCPVLIPLRGDFFCLPFGGNADAVDGVTFPCHGESATGRWQLLGSRREGDCVQLELGMEFKLTAGHITKRISLDDRHEAVYVEHEISGLEGRFPIGHHAIADYPHPGEQMYLAAADFDLGMVHPGIFSDPQNKEFQCLQPGAEFTDLTCVPSLFKSPDTIDCTTYPMPVGYTDIFAMFRKPAGKPSWTALVYPERGYIWYVLKDPAVLPGTAVWNANQGRYGAPWNGRTSCIGIEDCCSYFATGCRDSRRENELTKRGWDTAFDFKKNIPVSVRVIQGLARIPAGFSRIGKTAFTGNGIEFTDVNGLAAAAEVDWKFVL